MAERVSLQAYSFPPRAGTSVGSVDSDMSGFSFASNGSVFSNVGHHTPSSSVGSSKSQPSSSQQQQRQLRLQPSQGQMHAQQEVLACGTVGESGSATSTSPDWAHQLSLLSSPITLPPGFFDVPFESPAMSSSVPMQLAAPGGMQHRNSITHIGDTTITMHQPVAHMPMMMAIPGQQATPKTTAPLAASSMPIPIPRSSSPTELQQPFLQSSLFDTAPALMAFEQQILQGGFSFDDQSGIFAQLNGQAQEAAVQAQQSSAQQQQQQPQQPFAFDFSSIPSDLYFSNLSV